MCLRKNLRIALYTGKMERRFMLSKAGKLQGIQTAFTSVQKPVECCPEDFCLETSCGEDTEYPAPIKGALQGIPCRDSGARMRRWQQTLEGGSVQVQNLSERGEWFSLTTHPAIP